MANNKFQITITAADKASGIVSRVRKNLEGLAKQKGGVLGGAGKAIGDMGGRAQSAAAQFSSLSGTIGGLTAAGSVAGLSALAAEWGRVGLAVSQAAANIGTTANRLQTLRGAADLAGGSAEAMTQGLNTLGNTLQDARFGRNNQALAMLNQLGIGIHTTASGAVDAERAMNDLADAIARQSNPQTQALIARQFGLEGLLPVLRQGSAGMRAYAAEAERLSKSSPELIAQQEQLGLSLRKLESAATGVGNTLASRLIPQMQPLVTMATQWMDKNAGLAASIIEVGTALASLAAIARFAHPALAAILGTVAALKVLNENSGAIQDKFDKAATGWLQDKGIMPKPRGLTEDQQAYLDRVPDKKPEPEGGKAASPTAAAPAGREPIGIRQNNPGNLRQWPGAGQNGGYAQFGSANEGLTAAAQNLLSYQRKHGIDTIAGIVNRWAPAGDRNNVPAYISDLSKQTGFAPNQKLNLSDSKTLAPLLSGIVKHESGYNPYSADAIERAVQTALSNTPANRNGNDTININLSGLPTGVEATATNGQGAPVNVRIGHAMSMVGG